MTNEELKEKVLSIFPKADIADTKPYLTVTVPSGRAYEVMRALCDGNQTKFDYLVCLSGVDWGTSLGVVYHISSSVFKHLLVIKTSTANRENPQLDSVVSIWKGAEFHEREVFDLLGINFKNHPDMRRILLDDDWVGHPLRKDYTDEINIVER